MPYYGTNSPVKSKGAKKPKKGGAKKSSPMMKAVRSAYASKKG